MTERHDHEDHTCPSCGYCSQCWSEMVQDRDRKIESLRAPVAHWDDLRERLRRAENELTELANDAGRKQDTATFARLNAKRTGVSLALSYMRDYSEERE